MKYVNECYDTCKQDFSRLEFLIDSLSESEDKHEANDYIRRCNVRIDGLIVNLRELQSELSRKLQ